MSGVLSAFASSVVGLSYSETCGSSAVTSGGDPKTGAGSVTVTNYGYALGDPTFGSYGSISPGTFHGFPIIEAAWEDDTLVTTLEVNGDASAYSPGMLAAGADQHLGAPSFTSSASWTATVSIASPGVVTKTSHGMANGTPFIFQTTGALPTGFLPNTVYYVVNKTTNTFQLAATSGGSAINTSGSQSGTHTGYNNPITSWVSGTTVSNPFTGTVAVSLS